MTWEDEVLEILRSEFRNKIFRANDAIKVLNSKKGYSKGTVYRALHDLCERGLVKRLGRGIYRVPVERVIELEDRVKVSAEVTVDLIPGPLMKSKELLRSKGIEFMITGASLFYRHIHYLPKRLVHLVYVIKGAGELAVTSLRDAGLRALLNPTRTEISLALENFPERNVFLIREFSELFGNVNGKACLERALVDLYFETTREKIPFPEEEAGHIFLKVFRNEPINLTRLFMFASRRGVKEELKAITKFMEPDLPVEVGTKSKYVSNFVSAMEKT